MRRARDRAWADHFITIALILLSGAASEADAQEVELPDWCRSRSCRDHENAKAANLCQPTAGGAAAWSDDPFDPSIRGVAFYDSFDAEALIGQFGPTVSQSEWIDEYEERDPTTPETLERVPFDRYDFGNVAIETAALESLGRQPRVTKIEISSAELPLKCGLRVGLPWQTFQATLGLPDPNESPRNMPEGCSIFYDLYEIPFDQGGGFMWGDNSTLCFILADDRVSHIIWDKTRWASGYH